MDAIATGPLGVPAVVLLGALLGLRHALDPDHLAAVAATVSRHRHPGRAATVGALWGLGHASSVLVAGGAIVALGLVLPDWAAPVAEGVVGVVLIGLGVDLFAALARERMHLHVHAHGGSRHLHLHAHAERGPDHRQDPHEHVHPGRRAFLVGTAHGLAGSAAAAVLAAAATGSRAAGLLFLGVFGAGATLGMALATLSLSVPLRLTARAGERFLAAARAVGGGASIAVGAGLVHASLATLLAAP